MAGQDQRLSVQSMAGTSGNDCAGAFRFTNNTNVLGVLGGYSLSMAVDAPKNAGLPDWIGVPGIPANLAIPAHMADLHILPENPSIGAALTVIGAVTADSLATDASLFLIKSALALVPLPAGCSISPDIVLGIASTESGALHKAGEELLDSNVGAALDELRHVDDHFFTQAIESLKGKAPQCAANSLTSVLGAVTGVRGIAFLGKTIVNFGAWSASMIEGAVKYHLQPLRVLIEYQPIDR